MSPVFFRDSSEFRAWLEQNHSHAKEVWVGLLKKRKGHTLAFSYSDALELALCYGWIDGKLMSVDDASYMIRFTPRRADSIWSNKNLKKVGELIKAEMMQPSGKAIYEKRNPEKTESYLNQCANSVFSREMQDELEENPKAHAWFLRQSESYRKICIFWIMRAKQEATRQKRMKILIDCPALGLKIPLLRNDSGHKKGNL
ncbi:MAG: YdeI/OmpD-associated family protein [Lentimicrobium sp.]|nr:YdeI/OmpD-associated family protein [Lentimicrobium sp.]